MKKILRLLSIVVLVLILTGCRANYTITYENDKFTEKVEIIPGDEYVEDEGHPSYDEAKDNGVFADSEGKEKFIMDDDSSTSDIKLTHELENDTLDDLAIFGECFSNHTYSENDTSYYFSANGDFKCDYLNDDNGDSTFTLKTNAEVISNNANEVEENTYTWYLNSKKLSTDGIYFQVIKTKDNKSVINNNSSNLKLYIKAIFIIIFVICIIGIVIIFNKKNRR